ncbi:HEAT repeat domain-containing protein [candidate division KSB1 bacterium]
MLFQGNNKNTPASRLKEAEILPDERREEFKKYTEEYLASDNWKTRNVGVKLAGILRYNDVITRLINMLTDRTPDSLINRLLGGDYYQVGFIRRNCIRSLIQLKEYNDDIENALYTALNDPYWEVVTEAVKALVCLSPEDKYPGLEKRFITLLESDNFEVLATVIFSLGEIAANKEILQVLSRFYYFPNQKVKKTIIKTLYILLSRGIIKNKEELSKELEYIFIPLVVK